MERLWSSDAAMKYPKRWIVLVNLQDESATNKTFGDVYFVTEDKLKAYDTAIALGDSRGEKMVVEGFDNTQRWIGGLEVKCV